MAYVTAADIEERLDGWKAGALRPQEIEGWARQVRGEREPESDLVNEVLGYLQVAGRVKLEARDVELLKEALRSPDAVRRLSEKLAHAKAAPPTDAPSAVSGHDRLEALRQKSAKNRILQAVARRRWLYRAGWIGAFTSLPLGHLFQRAFDFDDFFEAGEVALTVIFLGMAAGWWLYERVYRPLECPFCAGAWSVFRQGLWLDLKEHRCPHCRHQFSSPALGPPRLRGPDEPY